MSKSNSSSSTPSTTSSKTIDRETHLLLSDNNRPNLTRSSKMRLFFKQMFILLWKSWMIRFVHYISTFFEIIYPLIMIFLFAYIYSRTSSLSSLSSETNLSSVVDQNGIKKPATKFHNPLFAVDFSAALPLTEIIYYAPDTLEVKHLLNALHKSMNIPKENIRDEHLRNRNTTFIPMKNVEEIRQHMQMVLINETFFDFGTYQAIGLNFRQISTPEGELDYEILIPVRAAARVSLNAYPKKINQAPISLTNMWMIPLIDVISRVNKEFLRQSRDFEINLNLIQMMRMPYPSYRDPKIAEFSVYDFLALFILLSYATFVPLIVKRITDEKSSKSKELLRMIGMSDTVFWASHFINSMIIIVVHGLFFSIAFVCFKNPLIVHSSLLLFFIMFIMFGAQMIMFGMLITTVFNRPVLAVIVMTILWLLFSTIIFRGYVPSVNPGTIGNNSFGTRFILSMLPMGSIIWFISILGAFENFDQSLTFSTINQSTIEYGNLTILVVMISVFLSYFIYAFLIWYIDNVWPFQYGMPKKPWFVFDPSYWQPKRSSENDEAKPELDAHSFEKDPVGLKTAIEIRNITKKFAEKTAVDNLWLNIYSHQLTVLLGHNGAGKSTTMNMITGIYPSTAGNIYVNGYDISAQTQMARQSIGLCTQENIQFPELTVFQHLKLYAILKDTKFSNVHQEIQRVLELIKLTDKRNVRASNLSGGMKRKLQLGMAMIGHTKILILDEPTSGLDAEARRIIWDLLISIRREKTILLTTHYMEEADVLADRIAIMNQGRLRCCGTPFFLKNAFGTGYQLRIEKQSERFNSQNFLSIIRNYIPTATLKSEIETEVIYTFNKLINGNNEKTDNDYQKRKLVEKFPSLFRDIENNRDEYGINSFGLSYSTLEDVFLAVEKDDDLLFESKSSIHRSKHLNDLNDTDHSQLQLRMTPKSEMVTGCQLIFNQFIALFLKRFHYARRYWQMILLQLIIPLIIFIIAFRITSFFSNKKNDSEFDSIPLNTEHLYGDNTESYYQGELTFSQSYKRIAERDHNNVIYIGQSKDFEDFIIDHNDNVAHFVRKVLYGMQEDERNGVYNVWFNNEQTYSPLLSIKAFFDSFLEMKSAQDLKTKAGIHMTLQPVSIDMTINGYSSSTMLSFTANIITWVITCLILLPIAFPFLAASYVLYPIKERTSKSKLLQMMGGVSPTVFWLSHFLFDLVYHLITISILYLFIYLFDVDKVFFDSSSKSSASVLYVILFVFGIATIPLAYFFSYIFNVSSSGFTFVLIIFLVTGLIANLIWSLIDLAVNNAGLDLSSINMGWTQSILPVIRFIPIFSMLFGYQKLFKANLFIKMCKEFSGNSSEICKNTDESFSKFFQGCCPEICEKTNSCYDSGSFSFGKFGSGQEIYSLLATGLFYMFMIILYENFYQYARKYLVRTFENLFNRIFRSNRSQPIHSKLFEDYDVSQEKERIASILADPIQRVNSDILIVDRLTKYFGSFTAVNQLSFGVRNDECFGLLGVNGAGKTTTFSMLTGDLFPSEGNAYINGQINLINNLSQFQRNIGYCPQFDALLDLLTGRETLQLMGILRGIPWNRLTNEVDDLIRMVDLQKHANKRTDVYSGGNKRKLSIALSLIGNPRLLFLDEPTAGVDPSARRKIWHLLGLIRSHFKSVIILTSHSMEECEALCTRIAIMVGGRFRCLGSTQHLRSKYGQGYTILIRLKREHENDDNYQQQCRRQIVNQIPSAKLTDYHQCLMTYQIDDKSIKWSKLFELMAQLNQELEFEDYIISDTTLESIFILFARNQQACHDLQ